MNYLQKKRLALMHGGRFKGYMRTVSGYPLTLTDCLGNRLADYSVYGNCIQDGTPSPHNPVEVQSVGDYDEVSGKYIIPVTVSGFNQFDKSLLEIRSAAGGGRGSNWFYVDSNKKMTTDKLYVKPGTNYTLVTYNNDVYWRDRIIEADENDICTYNHAQYTQDGSYVSSANIRVYNFKTQSTTSYIIIRFQEINYRELTQEDISDLQCALLEGTYTSSNIPPYEEGHIPVTVNIYLDKPLYGIGTHSDSLEINWNQRIAVRTNNCAKYIFTGHENDSGGIPNGDTCDIFGLAVYIPDSGAPNPREGFCNYLPYVSGGYTRQEEEVGTLNSNNHPYVYIKFAKASFPEYGASAGVEETQEVLTNYYNQGKPMYLIYQLAAPVIEDISSQINWNNIVKTYKGKSIITVGTSVPPSGMEVKYYSEREEE